MEWVSSSSDGEGMSEDMKKMIKKKKMMREEQKKKSIAYEHNYVVDEVVELQMDVYNLAIAANMNKNC